MKGIRSLFRGGRRDDGAAPRPDIGHGYEYGSSPQHLACRDCGCTWWISARARGLEPEGVVAFELDGTISSYSGSFDCVECLSPMESDAESAVIYDFRNGSKS